MKILKLTFENINSYEGKVEIDFTDPEFKNGNNQFVICGPMGAGKSTILDAITLALYGSTARLGALAKKDEALELINKRSGYCRSEVIYSCSKGIFKSTFYMRKADKKVDGKIQQAQCALTNITYGEPGTDLLAKAVTSKLQDMTAEIIGLTYDQFIRCILIPQGEFDVFLKSEKRDKASILAKLSHTEHYKRAGEILKNEAKECNDVYTNRKTARDAIQVLNNEERETAEKELKLLREDSVKQEEEQMALGNKISLLEQFQEKNTALAEAEKNKEDIKSKSEEYAKKTDILEKARKASDCSVEHHALKKCQEQQFEINKRKNEAQANLAEVSETQKPAKEKAKELRDDFEQKRADEEEHKVLWGKVRELDVKIKGARTAETEKEKASKRAEEELNEKTVSYKNHEVQLTESSAENTELKKYLDEHKADEDLAEVLASLAEKKSAWTKAEKNRKASEKEAADKREAHQQMINNLDKMKEEKTAISNELFALVSSKYLLVSEILRNDLKPGKPCPVCGKEVKSDEELAAHSDELVELTSEQQQVATDISDLTEQLDAKQEEINEFGKEIERTAGEIKNAEASAKQEEDNKKILLAGMNDLLQPWEVKLDDGVSEEELKTKQTELGVLKDVYQTKKTAFENNEKICSEAKAYMEGIDIDKLKQACTDAEKAYENAKKDLAGLEQLRAEMFGEESVDEVEKAFGKCLREKENKALKAEEELQGIQDEITRIKALIEGYLEQEKTLTEERSSSEKAFGEKLQKNGFASEAEFLNCHKPEEELKALDEDIKEFASRKTAADTAFDIAKESLEKHQVKMQEAGLTTEKLEDLKTQKAELDAKVKESAQKEGSLSQILTQDKENKKAWEKADNELAEASKMKDIYDRIGELIGVNNGADFEVFVQGIAMNSLLTEANNILDDIIPNYELKQKEENSIEFHVIETLPDNTEVKRELINFSGGEKFVISLSLALAMSEFAGENGDVECIFLDEGFGTLSGKPLDDAIAALKKLSTTGKMLGIITHIEPVIQAFNKIEALKSGERSVLKGPGVICTN